jgi:putative phosphoribosyl transferase
MMTGATPFTDRAHAGRLLAAELSAFGDRRPVVFALPRCGVPVAFEIAQHLGAPLDVALVRTVRAPDDERRLLATIIEGDPPEVRIEPDWDKSHISRAWLDEQVSEGLREVARRRRRYRDGDRPVCASGRIAIVVDQAIGPGHAMAGAIRLIRQSKPSMVVAAVPVASQAGAERFAKVADRLVCLHRETAELGPLGRYYAQAEQITHEEALSCLARAAEDEA